MLISLLTNVFQLGIITSVIRKFYHMEVMPMLAFLNEREEDYKVEKFIMELCEASKYLGALEAKINSYHFEKILIPLLRKKEAISSMQIEGTQTTMSEIFEEEIKSQSTTDKTAIEVQNHTKALIAGVEHLRENDFSHDFIKDIHRIMLEGVIAPKLQYSLGQYKTKDNRIVNSAKTVIFTPPSHTQTYDYMEELIEYMNREDEIHPLIKAAIIHSQFESIHPFEDGNGRVGRLLISLYLYKAKLINFPFFYISEAFGQEKTVYYSKLTDSRNSTFDEWIRFFLKKCTVQAKIHINYMNSLDELHKKTKATVQKAINSPNFDAIIECLFSQPVLTSSYLSQKVNVTAAQSKRYLKILQDAQILQSDDRQRYKRYFFVELLDLAYRL